MSWKSLTFIHSKGIPGVYGESWKVESNFGDDYGRISRLRFGKFRRWCYDPQDTKQIYPGDFAIQIGEKIKELEEKK